MCLTLGVYYIIYYTIIYYYIIIYYYYILYIIILYYYTYTYTYTIMSYILYIYYTLPSSDLSSFSLLFPSLLFLFPLPFPILSSHSQSSSSPSLPLLFHLILFQSLSFPEYLSAFGYPYLYTLPSQNNLTPHVLSEWMVEVCRFEVCVFVLVKGYRNHAGLCFELVLQV